MLRPKSVERDAVKRVGKGLRQSENHHDASRLLASQLFCVAVGTRYATPAAAQVAACG